MKWTADGRSLQHNGDLVEVFAHDDRWGFGIWLNTPAPDEATFHDQVISGARSAAGLWHGGRLDYRTQDDAKRAAEGHYQSLGRR